MDNNIILISLRKDELTDIIKTAVQSEFSVKRQKELMNFKETREFLGISTSCLNAWKRESKIPFKKLGKRIFFERSQVMEALKDSNYSKLRDLGQ